MDTRSIRTKTALANALRQEMQTQRFDKISVDHICSTAGVTRRNFYRHFLDKRDLLGYVYEQDFKFDFSEHPDWSIFDYFPLFCEVLYANRDFYLKAYTIEGQNNLREYCSSWLYPLLHRYTSKYFNDPDIERRIHKITTNATFDAFVDWLKAEPCLPPEDFIDIYMSTWRNFASLSTELLARSK